LNDNEGKKMGSGSMMQMALFGLFAIVFIALGAMAKDVAFELHMFIIALAAILTVIYYARNAHKVQTAEGPDAYLDDVIRYGAVATVFWGVVGFLVGLVIALELAYPNMLTGLEWFNFGRMRPLHTSAVVFAFGGNALLCT